MDGGVAVPNGFIAPYGRRLKRLRLPRRVRIAVRDFHLADCVSNRIEHGEIDSAFLRRPINHTVGIDGWIALVTRDFVMEVPLRVGPIPLRDDHIPFDSL